MLVSGGRRRKSYCPRLDKVALVHCDRNESPLVWDFRGRRFLEDNPGFVLVFVCHWTQLRQAEMILELFHEKVYALAIDGCCSWWFDNREVQAIVEAATESRVVDQPVALSNIIRNRARYPFHNTCRC